MNDAIALFMGESRMHPSDRRWHKDWNCLMPVVEKIRKGVSHREFDIGYTLFYENTNASALFHLYIYASIETVYDAVYQFITWLNQQKQKDGTT